jgi:hypothetical protein
MSIIYHWFLYVDVYLFYSYMWLFALLCVQRARHVEITVSYLLNNYAVLSVVFFKLNYLDYFIWLNIFLYNVNIGFELHLSGFLSKGLPKRSKVRAL